LQLTGTLFGLASALAWSFANLAIQAAARRLGPYAALFGAQLVGGAIALGAAVALEPAPMPPAPADLGYLALAAAAACLAYAGLFEALERGAAAVVAPIVSAWAAVTVGIEVLLLDRALSPIAMTGVLLVCAGNVVLARFGTRSAAGRTATPGRALVAAAISAVGFGVMVPATQRAAAWSGPIGAVPLVWGLQWVFGFALARRAGMRLSALRTNGALRLVALPGALEAIGFLALTLGMQRAPISTVAPASSLSTGLTVIWGIVLLGERLAPPAILGALIASAGVVLVNL
jgi:drug/metabolite transporter, DME family